MYSNRQISTNGNSLRRKSPEISVTAQAPRKEPITAAAAAGNIARQRICTLRLYCQVAMAVPQTEPLLLVPSRVAGGAEGKVANSAGTRISPPPPTMASTKPASAEAIEMMIHSMGGIVSLAVGWVFLLFGFCFLFECGCRVFAPAGE